jgi:hypothetical protein
MRASAVGCLLVAGTAGCGGGGPDPARVAEAEVRADAAARELAGALMKELAAALAKGGAAGAVDVCSVEAPRIAGEVTAREKLTVRRVSLRIRNPANAPDDHERRVLEEWAAGKPEVRSEVVAGEGGAELRWMRPVHVNSLCLACHGAPGEIDPGVKEALARRYPGDRATGFRDGDLRGAISVRVPIR